MMMMMMMMMALAMRGSGRQDLSRFNRTPAYCVLAATCAATDPSTGRSGSVHWVCGRCSIETFSKFSLWTAEHPACSTTSKRWDERCRCQLHCCISLLRPLHNGQLLHQLTGPKALCLCAGGGEALGKDAMRRGPPPIKLS